MKKFLVVLLACLLVLSLGVTAFAEPKVPAPNPVPGAREAVILNAGFHCNAHGGNGRVWVEAYDLKYEADKSLKKEGIGGVLEDLIYLDDNCWLLANKKDYVCPECGSSVWVSYSNKSGVPDGKNIQLTHGDKSIHKGKITMKKYVDEDGKIIEITADYAKYIECFNLYKVAGDGDPIEGKDPIDVARLNDGVFVFNNLEDGWYAVEEILTEAGKDIFVPAPVKYFLITNGVTYGCDVDFDYDAFYTIINGYGSGYVLGYPGLNNTGDIFPIGVRNTETGIEYPSFCANAGSRAFAGESGMGCSGYMVSKKIDRDCSTYADFVNAYNYIEDEFGSLNDNRAITQIISWILLGSIDIESEAFDNINWAIVESGAGSVNGVEDAKAKVVEVMENFADYSGKGKIVDIVFLVCEHEHDFYDCQPQLVPVYGKCGLINKLIPGGKVFPVSFIKEKYNGLLPVGAGEFAFDLFKITDGAEEKVGTFYNDAAGKVTAKDLKPGEYVFREVFGYATAWHPEGIETTGWGFLWSAEYPGGADGLYFDLTAGGDVIWKDVPVGDDPVVNNVYLCKHNIMWSAEYNYHGGCVENPNGAGWIVYNEGIGSWDKGIMEAVYYPATCTTPEHISFMCSVEKEAFGTGLTLSGPLGHDYDYDNPIPILFKEGIPTSGYIVYGCKNCADGYIEAEDLALWIKLTGFDPDTEWWL